MVHSRVVSYWCVLEARVNRFEMLRGAILKTSYIRRQIDLTHKRLNGRTLWKSLTRVLPLRKITTPRQHWKIFTAILCVAYNIVTLNSAQLRHWTRINNFRQMGDLNHALSK